MLSVIQGAEGYLRQSFGDTPVHGFLYGQGVVLLCLRGVLAAQVEVADSVEYLVQVFLVALVAGHSFKGLYFSLDI